MKKILLRNIAFLAGLAIAFAATSGDVSGEHPRLLFTLDDVEDLQAKVRDGWIAEAYQVLKSEADQMLAASGNNISESAALGRRINRRINYLMLAGYIEGDEAYSRKAVDFMLHYAEKYEPAHYFNNVNNFLGIGDVTHAFALGYDTLYPFMNRGERTYMRDRLEAFGSELYARSQQMYPQPSSFRDSSNWNPVGHGALGLAALVLGDRDEWLEKAVRQNRAYLLESTDADGWKGEGRGYFGYGGWGCLPFAAALKNAGGPDLVDELPKNATLTVDFFIRQMTPWGQGPIDGITMHLISKYQDRVGLWGWLSVLGSDGNGTFGQGTSDPLPYTLIWADPELEPLHPAEADLPLDKFFESDRAIFRDGWEALDSMAMMTGGYTAHSGHHMRNHNSFVFTALGERFVVHPPDAQVRMEVLHNLVMVDEPRTTRSAGEYTSVASFDQDALWTTDDAAYIKSDASSSNVYFEDASGDNMKVEAAERQLLYVRQPDGVAQPYLLIVDDLRKSPGAAPSQFSWLLQTALNNQIEIDVRSSSARIVGGRRGAVLHVDFLYPAGVQVGEYDLSGMPDIKGRVNDMSSLQQTMAGQVEGTEVRFVTLLMATESDQEKPEVKHTGDGFDGQVTIRFADGTVDTVVLSGDDGDLSFVRSHQSAFTNWAEGNIPEGFDRSFTGSALKDGVANSIKFAFGLDPMRSARAEDLPFARKDEEGRLTITYRVDLDAEGVIVVPEVALTLDSDVWFRELTARGAPYVVVDEGTHIEGSIYEFTATAMNIDDSSTAFMRVSIEAETVIE